MSTATASDKAQAAAHTIVELRQYVMRPDQRDVLIDLFDANFVESQNAPGMALVGQFRDLDDPDRFVWVRSFADMPTRAALLTAFYTGPLWKTHSRAANATMIDVRNVFLLRPARPDTGFPAAPLPPTTAKGPGRGLVVASIVYMHPTAEAGFEDFFEKEMRPKWEKAGTPVIAQLVTESSENTFPALPVREGEKVFVWFSRFADQSALDRHSKALATSPEWRALAVQFNRWTFQPIATLHLQPTARSRLQGG
ncbi:MAG: putative quinol monooxygenase [Steroidobacteraceae bacterium]